MSGSVCVLSQLGPWACLNVLLIAHCFCSRAQHAFSPLWPSPGALQNKIRPLAPFWIPRLTCVRVCSCQVLVL
jgi:hypothetical protein